MATLNGNQVFLLVSKSIKASNEISRRKDNKGFATYFLYVKCSSGIQQIGGGVSLNLVMEYFVIIVTTVGSLKMTMATKVSVMIFFNPVACLSILN